MNNFTLQIQRSDGSDNYEIPFASFTVSEEINVDRYAEIELNYQDVNVYAAQVGITPRQLFTLTYREAYIYDKNGNTVFGGFLKNISRQRDNGAAGSIRLACCGFFSILVKRFTAIDRVVSFSQQDLSDIAWSLINTTQSLSTTGANFGITRGADPTTRNADRTYVRKRISDAIMELSNANIKSGIDFEIDNNKVFNVYYPEKGSQRTDIVFEDGVNIDSYQFTQPLVGDMANDVTAIGDGDGLQAPYYNVTSETAYKTNFYLLQEYISQKDVSETDTLQNKAQRYLDMYKLPREYIKITCDYSAPAYEDYEVGDRVRVILPDEQIDGYYRIYRRSLDDKRNVTIDFSSI